MALNGRAARWIKGVFKPPKMPKPTAAAPTAGDLYSGPRAFSDYRPEGANVQGDAAGREAASNALRQIQQVAVTGQTPQQSQQMAAFLRQGQQATAGARQAALQGAASRGTASGGAGLLAGLAGGQQDANAAADAAAGMATQAENRRYDAMGQSAQLGLGMDAQTFGQGQANAQAMDAFNQFATGMQFNATQGGFENQRVMDQAAMDRYNAKMEQRRGRINAVLGLATSAASLGMAGRANRASGGGNASNSTAGGGGQSRYLSGAWDEEY